jgi:hypothetical protein
MGDQETPAVCNWRADAAPLLASLDRRQEARALGEAELERPRAFGTPVPVSAALRALGALDPGRGGIELLEQAVSALEGSPALLERSLAQLGVGSALRRAGRRADARDWSGHVRSNASVFNRSVGDGSLLAELCATSSGWTMA